MARMVAYSHDTYGLGNIRRMLAVCNYLVDAVPDLAILLISGSPMVQSFRVKRGIDYIKLPCLSRTAAEGYAVKTIGADLRETVELRAELILRTVDRFKPDILLVDKKPLGVEHELRDTLSYLDACRSQTQRVLLLRDILDSAEATMAVWRKQRYYEAVRKYYDRVLVVGSPEVFDLRKEYRFPAAAADKVRYCGYIGQEQPPRPREQVRRELGVQSDKLVLATVGGGEDGYELLRAYLAGLALRGPAAALDSVIVCGPEMAPSWRAELQRLARPLAGVQVREFVDDMLSAMNAADVVVAMGGYNTVCELLSLRKPAVLVPRALPVAEQWIRAQRLANLGFFRVIHPGSLSPVNLNHSIDGLLESNDSACLQPRLPLDALPRIAGHVEALLRAALSSSVAVSFEERCRA